MWNPGRDHESEMRAGWHSDSYTYLLPETPDLSTKGHCLWFYIDNSISPLMRFSLLVTMTQRLGLFGNNKSYIIKQP